MYLCMGPLSQIRKVDYKDPIEEEWERFQREIADATSVRNIL